MGEMVQASCECGYESGSLPFGAGMMDFTTTCMAPALCERCRNVVPGTLFPLEAVCPDCGAAVTFYTDVTLHDGPFPSEGSYTWRLPTGVEVVLPAERCTCPVCTEKQLRFLLRALFD